MIEDDPETVTALVAAAQVGRFEYVAQRARDNRAERARFTAKANELRTAGLPVGADNTCAARLPARTAQSRTPSKSPSR